MGCIQDFNYHTHTKKCKHAEENYEDEEYVKEAFKKGIKFLAFTDHIPFFKIKDTRSNVRMSYDESDDYIKSILSLQGKYEDIIKLETGFEFEYLPEEEENLLRMKSKVDKMVLGQHFILDNNGNIKYFSSKEKINDKEMIQYISLIDKALKLGIPDIIAHPDLFLKYRAELGEKEEYITRVFCELVQKYQVPMEINLNEIYREYIKAKNEIQGGTEGDIIQLAKSRIKYPNKDFWRILSEYKGIKVLFGIDAHFKGQIENSDISYKIANEILGEVINDLNFVDYKFDSISKTKLVEDRGNSDERL